MRVSRLLYRLLLILLGLPLLILFLWQGWHGGVKRYAKERLGFVKKRATDQKQPLWFHAASVGEVNAIIPLLKALVATQPEQSILLTTTTINGFQAAQRCIPTIKHHFLPFDFHHSVQRFIRRVQPKILFTIETEIWPNLFRECASCDTPIAIINGRLSVKTLTSPNWVRQLYGDALSHVEKIATRSESDLSAFIALGADPGKCKTLGNIKYASAVEYNDSIPVINEIDRPIVVAASTRTNEEAIIAASWRALNRGDYLLVIVPRHPERLIDILKDLACDQIAIRSRGENPTPKTAIYLADTFGELKSFMAHSELVIMGGSFVEKGGQNLIEPAAMGKTIIVGPHMENFADETRDLLDQQALVQVNNGDELTQKLSELLKNHRQREQLGERAEQFVISHANIIDDYMAFVEHALSKIH